MSWVEGPRRFADDGSGEFSELADAIRTLREDQGSAQQVRSLEHKLAAQLAAPSASVVAVGIGLWAKWLIGIGLLSAVGLTAGLIMARPAPSASAAATETLRSSAHAPSEPVSAAQATETPSMPSRRDGRTTPAQEDEPRFQEDEPRLAPERPGKQGNGASPSKKASVNEPVSPGKNQPATTGSAEAELALVQQSQAALDRDPAAALALTEEHVRRHPRGIFVQEREMIAIDALLKLKRKQAAVARATRFMHDHPESPHARRVRALLKDTGTWVERTSSPATAP